MAQFFFYQCNGCGYEVRTSGPHEFYRDNNGNKKIAGHPIPSKGAAQRGICGLSSIYYCPGCDENVDIILTEFEKNYRVQSQVEEAPKTLRNIVFQSGKLHMNLYENR